MSLSRRIASPLLFATLALSCKDEPSRPDGGVGTPDAAQPDFVDGGGLQLDDAGIPIVPDGGDVTFGNRDVLQSFAACATLTYGEFLTAATTLDAATTALAATPSPDSLATARNAYRAAMTTWQVAELMQFGPAGTPPPAQPGGQGLRNEVYAWPLDSRCEVEQQIVARGYESPSFATSLLNRRGLAALEYLLFYEGADTACPATSPIVATGSWAALTPDDRAARKRAYAARVSAAVLARATELVDAWAPDKGNFAATLASAGPGNAVYPTTQTAFNAVNQALYYIENDVREMKIAEPAQLRDCLTMPCRSDVESPYAGLSKENVRANVVGLRRIFQGCAGGYQGLGFDDLLVAKGAADLSSRMIQAIDAVFAALDAIAQPDLGSAIAQNKPAVVNLYEALRALKTLFETEFATVLDLDKPMRDDGDND